MRQSTPGEVTHGMTGTSLYRCWKNMKVRCTNPNSERYKHYGGRGIEICSDWNEFENFMDWALDNGYREGLTIDRIDVDSGYNPANCRWISYEENHNLMMKDNLAKGSGIFSEESKLKSKQGLRKSLGKPVKINLNGIETSFNSRGEAIDYLTKKLQRNRDSVKSQLNLCLKNKCKTIGGYEVYE